MRQAGAEGDVLTTSASSRWTALTMTRTVREASPASPKNLHLLLRRPLLWSALTQRNRLEARPQNGQRKASRRPEPFFGEVSNGLLV